jgi:hypothetical protein
MCQKLHRALRRIFRRKREEMGKLHDLYASPNVIRVIKSRRMRWAGYVARMGDMKICEKFWWQT